MSSLTPLLGTRAQQGFLGTVIVQAVAVVAMVATAFGKVQAKVGDFDEQQGRLRTLPCYFALFALAELFYIIMTLDALNLRNIIQLVGLLIFHVGLLVFSGLQIKQTRDALCHEGLGPIGKCSGSHSLYHTVLKYQIVIPSILGASLLVLAYFTWLLYAEFGWAVFRIIGADPRKKRMFRFYQVLICLLKFDYFCFTGLTMQLLILVVSNNSAEFGLTIAALPIVLILLTACGIAVMREIKWLMSVSLVLMCGAEAYFVYKFVRLFTASSRHRYDTTRVTLAVFIIVSFLLLLLTFAMGVVCMIDFDKGLREGKINEPSSLPRMPFQKSDRESKMMMQTPGSATNGQGDRGSYFGGQALAPRVSIE